MTYDNLDQDADGTVNVPNQYSGTQTVSGDATAIGGSYHLVTSSSDLTITLPEPRDTEQVGIQKVSSDNNVITIETPNSETIDGQDFITISNENVSKEIISDGSDYYIIR